MNAAVELQGMLVRFARFTLGPLDLTVPPGRVVGVVGPNGSGKTTTLRCLAGNLYPDAGGFAVFGHRPTVHDGSWKALVGYVPDRPAFYEWMSPRRFLGFVSRFHPSWSEALAGELASRLRLDLDGKLAHLSPGNRVKVSLVAALAHRPKLALFDEPTAGLDPVVRSEVFDVLTELLEDGRTSLLYSTHILDDLQRLADELVFLSDGAITLQATKDDLLDRWRRLLFRYGGELPGLEGVVHETRRGETREVVTRDGERTIAALHAGGIENVRASALSLDEIAVHIMKGVGDA
jgi:ABC-2 type transport system ATP-binding protein